MKSNITVGQNYNRQSKLKPKPPNLIYYNRRVVLLGKSSTINDATCSIICHKAYLGLLLIKEVGRMGRSTSAKKPIPIG